MIRACRVSRLEVLAVSIAALLAAGAMRARAEESVLPITPPSATDIDQALLPPVTGWYGGVVILPYNQNTKSYDTSGNFIPAYRGVKVSAPALAIPILYVYPFKPLGWTLASSFVQPFYVLSDTVGSNFRETQTGAVDAYSDVLVGSKTLGLFGATPGGLPMPYGLTVSLGFSLIVPDGHYERDKPITLSSNSWVLDPNLAMTWNSGPRLSFGDNTQLSAKLFYGIPYQNPSTHYRSGNILDVDMSATEQFHRIRLGVAGSYQTQITADDPGTGASLADGNRFSEALFGPVAEYLFRSGSLLKVKYQDTFYHRNFIDERILSLQYDFRF